MKARFVIHWDSVLPVLVSIGIIIAVAVLRHQSKQLAAIVAVMPINIPLGMWIIYAGAEDKQAELAEFSRALFVNILPTLAFMLVAWWMARNGRGLLPTVAAGYAVWGVGLLLLLRLQGRA